MSANTEYVVATVLAANTSGSGVGGPEVVAAPHPLDNVRSIYIMLGITNTKRYGTINVNNFTSMEYFDYISVDDAKSFVKVWKKTSQEVDTKFGMSTQSKLQGFLY